MFLLQDKYGSNIFDLPKPTFMQLYGLRGGVVDSTRSENWEKKEEIYTPGSSNNGKWTRIEDAFPIRNGDIPASYVRLPEGTRWKKERIYPPWN